MPIFSAGVSRWPTASSQLPIRLRITSASIGTSRHTATQSSGLRMLDDRAKVWRANNCRRAALMRVERSSACSSMARAARRLASSASCRFFSLSSSLAATSVVGAASPDFGVSSARRFAEAARRGVSSAIAPCKASSSASFWARRVCRSASARFLSLSAASVEVRAARVWSRSSGCASCAQARPSARMTKARERPNATGAMRVQASSTGKDGPEADSAARSLPPSDHGRVAAATGTPARTLCSLWAMKRAARPARLC